MLYLFIKYLCLAIVFDEGECYLIRKKLRFMDYVSINTKLASPKIIQGQMTSSSCSSMYFG